jgi:hypothetical protein
VPEVIVVGRGPGLLFQGMIPVPEADQTRQVTADKSENAQGLPLSDMGQLVRQERFGDLDTPAEENKTAPDLGLSPTGDEPRDGNETDRRLIHSEKCKVKRERWKGEKTGDRRPRQRRTGDRGRGAGEKTVLSPEYGPGGGNIRA